MTLIITVTSQMTHICIFLPLYVSTYAELHLKIHCRFIPNNSLCDNKHNWAISALTYLQ